MCNKKTGNICTNVTLPGQPLLLWKSIKYYMFWVQMCSIILSSVASGIPKGGRGSNPPPPPPPPEILKLCQSWAEIPVPWNIHPWQPDQNMGFIHLQIEWNPRLGGYRPQIPILSALYPQLNFLNTPPPPLRKKNSWVRHCLWPAHSTKIFTLSHMKQASWKKIY
jgi:hypothetical protein